MDKTVLDARRWRTLVGAGAGLLEWFALAELLRGEIRTRAVWKLGFATLLGAAAGVMSERLLGAVTIGAGAVLAMVALTPSTQWPATGTLRSDPLG